MVPLLLIWVTLMKMGEVILIESLVNLNKPEIKWLGTQEYFYGNRKLHCCKWSGVGQQGQCLRYRQRRGRNSSISTCFPLLPLPFAVQGVHAEGRLGGAIKPMQVLISKKCHIAGFCHSYYLEFHILPFGCFPYSLSKHLPLSHNRTRSHLPEGTIEAASLQRNKAVFLVTTARRRYRSIYN